MTILIKNQTLFQPASLEKLRRGVISALYSLSRTGHTLVFDENLADEMSELLINEGITLEKLSGQNPDAVIGTEVNSEKLTWRVDDSGLRHFDSWASLADSIRKPARTADVHRKTSETDIRVSINLDGDGKHEISSGLNFLDHMLEQIARHGHIDLKLNCSGDLHIDEHHTIEDCALALGECLTKALGDKRGIERYASVLPMDESRAMVALDLSGRPYLVFEGHFSREKVGDVPTEMIKHFFYSLAMNLKATLHIEFKGENDHHQIEAIFKGFARVLREAVRRTGGDRIPSSKGVL